MKHIVILVLSIWTVYGSSDPKKCEMIGRGSVCDDLLKGYYECDGSSPDGVYHECNPGYMCSCYLNIRCDESKPKCIKRPDLPPVPKDFIVSFTGQINITFPTGSNSEDFTGTIYQDFTGQRVLKKTTYTKDGKFNRRVTELTTQVTGYPNFVDYVLTESKDGSFHCTANQVAIFKDLFYDLRLRSYSESDGVFVYRDGPIHGGDNAVLQRWEYTNLNGLQYSPRFYTYLDSGSVASKTSTSIKIRDNYYHMLRPHSITFRVPYQCANTVIH